MPQEKCKGCGNRPKACVCWATEFNPKPLEEKEKKIMLIEDLVGKTIKSIDTSRKIEGYDDEPFLDLVFTDGTKCTFKAGFGGYSGSSEDEYPCYIVLLEEKEEI